MDDSVDTVERSGGGESSESDTEFEDAVHTETVASSEELSDGQAEDMLEDLHNLLYLHGPQPRGEADMGAAGGAALGEQLPGVEEDIHAEVDTLPEEYHYLRELQYNQPREPRRGDIIKYFDFNFEGWLRVQVVSKHKKSSKYAGSVNCTFLDIDREPDGLYFYPGASGP